MPIESFQSYLKRKEQEKNNPLNLSPSIDDLDTQIRNAKARIQDAGFNADKETDDRNAFEKFTNLPQGQNAFFDTLELIGRPGNAIRNTIKNTFIEKDQDFLTSLRKGISGKQNVSGSDLLKSAGWEGDTTGTKIGRGIAGFGVDILTDPTNLIPAGLIAKAGSRVISPFAKGARAGYKALENASPGFRKVSEEKIIPFAKRTKDALGKAFVPGYRYGDQLRVDNEGNLLIEETDNQFLKNIQDEADRTRSYLQEESIREVSKAAKATGLDEGTNVGRIMESNLQINKDAEELVRDILKGRDVKLNLTDGDPQDLVQRINTELLNSPEVKQAVRQNESNINRIDDNLIKLQGVDIDEVIRKINAGERLSTNERNLYTDYSDASKSLELMNSQIDRLQGIRNKTISKNASISEKIDSLNSEIEDLINDYGLEENSPEIKKLVSEIKREKKQIKSTKLIEKQIDSRKKQIAKHLQTIRNVTGETYRNAIKKMNDGIPLDENEISIIANIQRLNQARKKLKDKGDNIKRGISFNSLDSLSQRVNGEGFEIINPMPRLYKNAAGNLREFLKSISKKGDFDQVVKKEFQNTLRPIFDELFKNGNVSTSLLKGSPELNELIRVLGNDIKIKSNAKGSTISLIQNDPNKMYYLLNQAKTEVPESLTNPVMQSGEDIINIANSSDFPRLNEAGVFDEVRNPSEFAGRVSNVEGKRYTAKDRQQAVELLRGNKSVNQELKDINREITVLRKEETESIRNFNEANGLKMSKAELNEAVEAALQAKPFYQQILQRAEQLNIAKEKTKDLVEFLRTETLNQSNLNIADLQFTDLIQLVKFERPIRELSQSPMVNLAAKTFTDSNSWLLDYARENGIDIQEIAGYMTHILSQEARKAKEMAKGKPIDSGTFGPLQGNKNVVKRRKYEGSAEDVNELMDKFVFETNAFFSTAIGQKRLIDYIAAESAKRKLLSNPNFAMKYQEGMSVPEGARLISPDQFKFFKVDTPNGNQFLSLKKGEQYVVTEPAFQLLQRYDRAINDEGIRGVLKAVDTVTGTFKRLALFSPGYHIRNVLGAMWNNYIGGMDATDLAKYTSDASNEVTNAVFKEVESDLFREYRQQGLAATSLNKIDMALPGKEPEDIIRETVEDLSKTTGQRVSDRINPLNSQAWKNIFQTSREAGDFFDQINRFALYKWAREKKNYSPEKATELVKAVQFDYTNLTNFEREVMTRIFPFYRWSRNNIPFQLQKFVSDPRKFMRLYYANQEAKEEAKIDEKKQPSYMRNTFNLPFGNRKEGTTFTANLPAEDLSKISGAAAFGKMLVDSINPSLKLPIELVANRNLFTNREISEFEGQRSGLGLPMKADYVLQTLGGMPGRALSGFASKSEAEQINPSSSTAKLLGLPSRPYNQQKNEQIRKIQDLQKLRDLIDRIEQDTGKRPRSINEITSGQGR